MTLAVRVVALVVAMLCIVMIFAGTAGWSTTRVVDVRAVSLDAGRAYFVRLPAHRFAALLRVDVDSTSDARRSRLRLLEDGRVLGPAHSAHDAIREAGAGRYSHWNEPTALYFSSSDGTDPRTNGRRYEAIVKLRLAPGIVAAAVIIIMALGYATRRHWWALVSKPSVLLGAIMRSWVLGLKTRASWTLTPIAAIWLLTVFLLAWRPTVEYTVEPERMQPLNGFAYVVNVAGIAPRGYQLLGDDGSHPDRSDMRLFWNESPLLPAHSAHADIIAKGGGAYSHWATHVYFSLPDNSDPRLGGGRLVLRASVSLVPALYAVGTILWVLLSIAGLIVLRASPSFDRRAAWARTRVLKAVAWLDRPPARIGAVMSVAVVTAVVTGADWDKYFVALDSESYIANQFVEPAPRPPLLATWISLFSDRAAVGETVLTLTRSGDLQRPHGDQPGDPVLPVVKAQRVMLLLAFVALAAAAVKWTSSIGIAIGFGVIAYGKEPFGVPAIWTAAVVALGFVALVSQWLASRSEPAKAGERPPDRFAKLVPSLLVGARTIVVAAMLYVVVRPLTSFSFLSEEQLFLMSETLAMSWHLLFAASAGWFAWTRSGTALVLAGVFAALSYLTRSASVFVPMLFAGLVALHALRDWRRNVPSCLLALGIAAVLANAAPISSAVRSGEAAGSAPMMNWGPVAFALEVAKSEDAALLSDGQSRAFLLAALALRDSPQSRREPNPPFRAYNLGANLYYVAHPAARQVLGVRQFDVMRDYAKVDALFGSVARPVLAHHFGAYAGLVIESLTVATGVHPTASTTRLFGSVWHWVIAGALIALAFAGGHRERRVGLTATILVLMHIIHVSVVAAFDVPIARYVHATEIFVAVAIVMLLDLHIRAITASAAPHWWRNTPGRERSGVSGEVVARGQ